MKPFNLQAALAGKPVGTRNGKVVTGFTKFAGLKKPFEYVAVLAGTIHAFTDEGKFLYSVGKIEIEHEFDLVMRVEKHQVFLNIFRDDNQRQGKELRDGEIFVGRFIHKNKEDADATGKDRLAVAVAEWEE